MLIPNAGDQRSHTAVEAMSAVLCDAAENVCDLPRGNLKARITCDKQAKALSAATQSGTLSVTRDSGKLIIEPFRLVSFEQGNSLCLPWAPEDFDLLTLLCWMQYLTG